MARHMPWYNIQSGSYYTNTWQPERLKSIRIRERLPPLPTAVNRARHSQIGPWGGLKVQ